MRWLFFLVFISFVHAKQVELFCDWLCDAKGAVELFDSEKDCSAQSLIAKKMKERGDELKYWEFDHYRPLLLQKSAIRNFADLKAYLYSKPEVDAKYWMFWNLGPKLKECNLARVPKDQLVLVIFEPPTVQPELYDPKIQAMFGKIFTWDDDLVDNKKFFKFHYPVLRDQVAKIPSFEEKKFCVMIARRLTSKHPKELYSHRFKMIKFFEDKPSGEFDLFGYFWEKKKLKNWRGVLHSDKLEKMKEYKFAICYENMCDVRGYVTEKIFDCFAAAVIPVYWGASNVVDYIPADCFIDRRNFADEEAVYQFLKKMTKEEYEGYLERIQNFLQSDRARVFSKESFVDTYLSNLY